MIKAFFKMITCKHNEVEFIRNIYGDEINFRNGNRSEFKCVRCGRIVYKKELYDEDKEKAK